jgi:DNA-directed RNA polymerase subunit RPC12/RpoP
MGLFTDTISCPKCGSLCNHQKPGNVYIYIIYLIIIIALGFVSIGISIICLIIWLAINKYTINKPIVCSNCSYKWIPK